MAAPTRRIYLDHNATTPVAPEVVEAMLPYFTETFGNASSIHWFGQAAKKGTDRAREQVADLIHADPAEIVFTGGGTEADNQAVFGTASKLAAKGRHLITSAIEHEAVLHAVKTLEKRGYEATYLPVDEFGMVHPDSVRDALRPDTVLVSVMAANNEVGTINPIAEIGKICRERGVLFHTDAVQAAGKLPIDVRAWNVDLLSLAGHKLYGPKGVGVLYIRKGIKIDPYLIGGHHEKKRRAGTENVPGIVGLGAAAALAAARLPEESKRLMALRDALEARILAAVPHVRRNGHPEHRTCNTLNLSFQFIEGEGILLSLDYKGIAVSTGSACTSGDLAPSHVLLAMGVPVHVAHGAIRFSLGHSTTADDLDVVVAALSEVVPRLRAMSPIYDKFLKGQEIDPSAYGDDHDHGEADQDD
jgi:cysteine desulfurase